jgi:hypothetical protein
VDECCGGVHLATGADRFITIYWQLSSAGTCSRHLAGASCLKLVAQQQAYAGSLLGVEHGRPSAITKSCVAVLGVCEQRPYDLSNC